MKDFKGGVAVITGGASGIGLEFARTAAGLGMKLALADIQQDVLDEAVKSLRDEGTEVIGVRTDVSKDEDVKALADQTMQAFGKINLLFNNAGVSLGGMIWEPSRKDWDWIMGVNVHGIVNGLRAFVPLMLDAARKDPGYEGHIVNTASFAGLVMGPAMGVYGTTKYAAVAISESLYFDLDVMTEQIHCSVLCPTYIPTNILRAVPPADQAKAAAPTKTQEIARKMAEQLVNTGALTASLVSNVTFDAIREQRFWVIPDPIPLSVARLRHDSITTMSNPATVFEDYPSISKRRQMLIDALRE